MSRITRLLMCLAFVALVAMFVLAYVNRVAPRNGYVNRGIAWQNKKQYDKAIGDYNEAIRLDPTFALAYNNRGNAWRDKKEYAKAIADYNDAIRLDPMYAPAYASRGAAWGP